MHSLDMYYDAKLMDVVAALSLVADNPKAYVLLYEDELTYYRSETVAHGYVVAGSDAPRADQGCGAKKWRRIAVSIDVWDGRLTYWQRDAFDSKTLLRYYRAVEAAYPDARLIFIALDNWPPHFQADVVQELASSASKLILLPLPTYAPWTNPVEKVWHKLYREVLHLHKQANDWKGLQARVEEELANYSVGSYSLLRYVGLYPH